MTDSTSIPNTAVVLVAAGRGFRAGGGIPKQYRLLGGVPILRRTLTRLLADESLRPIVTVIHPDDRAFHDQAVEGLDDGRLAPPVAGGETRQASVLSGLSALEPMRPARVIVHDAARPLAPNDLFRATIAALDTHAGAIAALPITDTPKRAALDGTIAETVDRSRLYGAQTPQAFRYDVLLAAHRAAAAIGKTDFTDDASLLEWQGERVALVPGSPDNIKITEPADFTRAEFLLASQVAMETRTGIGYDVHAFTDGDYVTLGGIQIPHKRGILAHSDGDVALHAATDALLGALGDGDIGTHFPPSDMRWKGASSDQFLAFSVEKVRHVGGNIVNLDITIVAEAPRVGPHREAMRAAIAKAAGITPNRVSIKATTSEKLGFTGRKEGLAAIAVATIELPRGRP